MFVAANRFAIADGYGDAFVERFENRRQRLQDQPGFVRFDLLAPTGDTDVYVAQTYWESEADFVAWTESDAFAASHSGDAPREMFEGHPSLETFEAAISVE